MELRHLRYFATVAREGHITRAAERLGIAQPPLSRQIGALEAEVGVRLLRRHARGVTPTEAGRAFLADAEAVLAAAERAALHARRAGRGETGRIAVGFTTSAPFHPLVARAIRQFRQSRPSVAFTLDETGSAELLTGLREDRLDCAFIRSPPADRAGLELHALLSEPMVAALPPGHGLRARKSLRLGDLAGETFILYRRPDGRGLHDAILAACAIAGFAPQVGQEAPRIVSTLNLVAAGLGITLVPASLARLPMEGVAYRPLSGRPALAVPLVLACRRGEGSVAVRAFVDLTRRLARQAG